MKTYDVHEKQRVALSSVVAAIFLTTVKFVVGISTNSLGILSEAAHSGLDLLAAGMTYVAVRIADRPPDDEHHYGHGKLESISAFFETLLLIITCGWIIYEAIDRFFNRAHHVEVTVWSFLVMAISIVIDIGRSRALYKTAKKYHSQALEADALHFSSDVWSSFTVIVGLVFVSLGFPEFDAFAAIIVAVLILFVSYRMGQRTIDVLMDRVPKEKFRAIEEAIRSVPGVEEVRNIRVRSSGSHVFVDTVVAIRRTLPFQYAHDIMDKIEKKVLAIEPLADVIVHAEPYVSNDETLVDKIRMIVVDHHLAPPHNLEVHESDGKYHVDFDIEYKNSYTFVDAHAFTSKIEEKIKEELPSVEKVTIHIENVEGNEHTLTNVTNAEDSLAKRICELVLTHDDILSCRNVTILQGGEKYHVSFDCSLRRTKTIEEVHSIISNIERTLYKNIPQISRITIHAEPE
ncbi:MAG: cation-efflux pump [Bacteroidetes bacterium]|nr:cation-efflux pump [Bacteroidota bacterium]